MDNFITRWPLILRAPVILLAALLIGVLVHAVLFRMLRRITGKAPAAISNAIVNEIRAPLRLLLPLLAMLLSVPAIVLPDNWEARLLHALGLALVGATAWLATTIVTVLEEFVALRYSIDVPDNLTARRIRTQTAVLRRILIVLIAMIAIALALMSFPSIRQIGASLLASAGLAGLVIGLAARPVITNLLAGIQLALSEPIRLDDVVIVEGEWGRIEEITTTYVVVRIWDLRRLVVPLSYFIEKPFQNWTRRSSDLLGTVFLYTDYTIPVEDVRSELHRLLQQNKLWDGKVWGLQVTDANDRTVELRALMSASDASKAFDLRCSIRENLIAYLQEKHPHSLPRHRAELYGDSRPVQASAAL